MNETDQVVADGLAAFAAGDLGALEALLASDVELLWYEPGNWDCHGRDEVTALFRQRQAEGQLRPYPVRIDPVNERTVVVSEAEPGTRRGPEPYPVATVVTIDGGRIVRMRQYRTREDALRHASGGGAPDRPAPAAET